MHLLIITQKVDRNDSNLGFFHAWLKKIAESVTMLTVICLEEGKHAFPGNVRVISLGKERKVSRLMYLWRFYRYILQLRAEYDGVFVHMNPEYMVLGGLFWKLLHKPVLLWYVHKSINWKLRIAEKLVTGVYTASAESFLLPSRKVKVVGHGIDVTHFSPRTIPIATSRPLRILTVGRITPAKDLLVMLQALKILSIAEPAKRHMVFDIVGAPVASGDYAYERHIKAFIADGAMNNFVHLLGPKNYNELPPLYRDHDLFLNASTTGLDKAVLEALASGLIVLSSSHACCAISTVSTFKAGDSADLAEQIEKIAQSDILNLPNSEGVRWVKETHNLDNLIGKIIDFYELAGT